MCSWGSGAFEGRPGNADSAAEAAGAGTGGEGGRHQHWDPCRQTGRRLNHHHHPKWQTDGCRDERRGSLFDSTELLFIFRRWLTSRCLRPGTAAAAVSLAGERGGEGSTRSLSAAGEGSGGYAPGFFCNETEDTNIWLWFSLLLCISVFAWMWLRYIHSGTVLKHNFEVFVFWLFQFSGTLYFQSTSFGGKLCTFYSLHVYIYIWYFQLLVTCIRAKVNIFNAI